MGDRTVAPQPRLESYSPYSHAVYNFSTAWSGKKIDPITAYTTAQIAQNSESVRDKQLSLVRRASCLVVGVILIVPYVNAIVLRILKGINYSILRPNELVNEVSKKLCRGEQVEQQDIETILKENPKYFDYLINIVPQRTISCLPEGSTNVYKNKIDLFTDFLNTFNTFAKHVETAPSNQKTIGSYSSGTSTSSNATDLWAAHALKLLETLEAANQSEKSISRQDQVTQVNLLTSLKSNISGGIKISQRDVEEALSANATHFDTLMNILPQQTLELLPEGSTEAYQKDTGLFVDLLNSYAENQRLTSISADSSEIVSVWEKHLTLLEAALPQPDETEKSSDQSKIIIEEAS